MGRRKAPGCLLDPFTAPAVAVRRCNNNNNKKKKKGQAPAHRHVGLLGEELVQLREHLRLHLHHKLHFDLREREGEGREGGKEVGAAQRAGWTVLASRGQIVSQPGPEGWAREGGAAPARGEHGKGAGGGRKEQRGAAEGPHAAGSSSIACARPARRRPAPSIRCPRCAQFLSSVPPSASARAHLVDGLGHAGAATQRPGRRAGGGRRVLVHPGQRRLQGGLGAVQRGLAGCEQRAFFLWVGVWTALQESQLGIAARCMPGRSRVRARRATSRRV